MRSLWTIDWGERLHTSDDHVIGTLRLLVLAKDKGLIAGVKPLIEKLKEVGFWISEDVYKDILLQTQET
ncbi:MAG: DUF3368 domain-containing protein [Candidatus Brocadia sp.]|nr:DUF3368 domain-containing protein [Candidatus Brocadia sp.]